MKVFDESKDFYNGVKQPGQFVNFPLLNLTEIEVDFKCEKHNRTYKVKALKNSRGDILNARCPECDKEKEEEEKKDALEKEKTQLIEKYKSMNIEPEYWQKSIDDYRPKTQKQFEYLAAIKNLIQKRKGKLIAVGGNGIGKTMLACEALKVLGGVSYTMFQISLKIRKKGIDEEEFANSLADVPLLVVDEIGKSKGSDFELNLLSYVLDKRHTRNKPFIILSNTHFMKDCPTKGCPKCFERYFDNDLLSRFRQNGKIISFEEDAPDYRNPKNKDIFKDVEK